MPWNINDSLTADNSQKFQFAYDAESGKYGYMAKVEGADTFCPFNEGASTPFMVAFSYEYFGGDSSYRTLSWTAPTNCNVMVRKNGDMKINGISLEDSGYKFEYNESFPDRTYPSYCIFDVKLEDKITMFGSYLIKEIAAFRYV